MTPARPDPRERLSADAHLRVMFVINGMAVGGAEVQVRDLALAMRRSGHEISVVSMLPFECFGPQLSAAGIEISSLEMTRGVPSVLGLARFVRAIYRRQPDIVHAHMFAAIMLARAAHPFAPKPKLVCSSHASFEVPPRRYLAYRWSHRLSDLCTNVAKAGLEEHERTRAIPIGHGRVVPNGVDLHRFRPRPTEREAQRSRLGLSEHFTWLAVGSFHNDMKDFGNLLRAFALLPPESARLLIAGDGLGRAGKEALGRSLGLGHRVRFLGARSDVEQLMVASDAFVLSSRYEALPLVVIEAIASGLPVVATRVGGVEDIVVDGESGFLVPHSDPGALAAGMTRLMAVSGPARAAMQTSAHSRSRAFCIDAVSERWLGIYRDLQSSTPVAGEPGPVNLERLSVGVQSK